jgi:hypothetical protein
VTVHSYRRAVDELNTYDELIQFWQSLDDPLTCEELRDLWHPRTPRIIVVARCAVAITMVTILVYLPMALRAVGE